MWGRLVVVAVLIVPVSWLALTLLARRLPPGLAKDLATALPACVTTARRLRRDPRVPRRTKLAVGFAMVWVLSPIDLIPEFLPVIGAFDDIIVVALALRYAARQIPPDVLVEAWPAERRLLARIAPSTVDVVYPSASEVTRHHDDDVPDGATPWVDDHRPPTGIEIADPDPSWPTMYAAIASRVRGALGDRVVTVEHVGSTAVPGLPAKPIIDVDLIVADSADEATYIPDLERAGFSLVIREPWWQEHRCLVGIDPRCNLHVFSPGAPEPVRHRIFRDWLRAHPEDRSRYAEAKLLAATASNESGEDVSGYNARKQAVIREIYDRAFRAAGLLRDE